MSNMTGSADVLVASAIAIAILMFGTWLLSLALKNASIVDIVWGSGFVVVAWVSFAVSDGDSARKWVLAVLVSLWGLRLAGYLAKRNIGHGEDYRYRAMRKHWGPRFPVISLVTVFLLQGVLMWVVSLGVQLGQVPDSPTFGPIGTMGVLVWAVGLAFEAVGDLQLARFKADPANQGKVMDKGLWRLTRHPNYFGDAVVWWGIAIVAAESGLGAWGFLSAAVMTFLLVRVSGVALLEKSLSKRKEGYAEYVARTSSFFPRPPKA
jgi:steroid 5-alpha reductase family enzyme